MLKYSDNLLIEAIGDEGIKITQSKDGCDFINYLKEVKTDQNLKVSLQTDRFILVESEGIKSVRKNDSSVVLETVEGEYTLPVMRERGSLLVEPPVVLPGTDPESWEYDFSGKSINVSFSNSMSLASSMVIVGTDLAARSINNVLEVYGDTSTAKFSMTPKQFALAQKAGKSVVRYWSSGEVLIKGENGVEVAIKKTRPPLDVAGLETRLSSEAKTVEADLSSLKVKAFGKFIVEKLILSFTNGKATFITESARKSIDCPGLELQEPLSLEIMAKDLKYVIGKVSIGPIVFSGQTRYIIRTEDKDKVIYVLVNKTV